MDMIVTTYESWFHYYDPETKQQSDQWKNTNSSPPKKAKVTKPFGETQYPQYPMAKTHETVNSNHFCKVI